jgi:hypothetical protein
LENDEVFILVDGGLMFATVVILSLFGLEIIDIYLGLFALELFLTSEFTAPLVPAESRRRMVVGIVMIVIFIGAILKRIMSLSGVRV